MELKWGDAREIAERLCERYPQMIPTTLRLTELYAMVLALSEFKDDPRKGNEARLDAILQIWIDEVD